MSEDFIPEFTQEMYPMHIWHGTDCRIVSQEDVLNHPEIQSNKGSNNEVNCVCLSVCIYVYKRGCALVIMHVCGS